MVFHLAFLHLLNMDSPPYLLMRSWSVIPPKSQPSTGQARMKVSPDLAYPITALCFPHLGQTHLNVSFPLKLSLRFTPFSLRDISTKNGYSMCRSVLNLYPIKITPIVTNCLHLSVLNTQTLIDRVGMRFWTLRELRDPQGSKQSTSNSPKGINIRKNVI